jgi:hypothetical protein
MQINQKHTRTTGKKTIYTFLFTFSLSLLIAPSAQAEEQKHETIPGKTLAIKFDGKQQTYKLKCILQQALNDKDQKKWDYWKSFDKSENDAQLKGDHLTVLKDVLYHWNGVTGWKAGTKDVFGDPQPSQRVGLTRESWPDIDKPVTIKVKFNKPKYSSDVPNFGVDIDLDYKQPNHVFSQLYSAKIELRLKDIPKKCRL